MRNQKYLSAASVISSVTWLIIAMMMLILALMIFFLNAFDNQFFQDTHARVDIAFTLEQENLYNLNIEYSYWNEAYQLSVAKPDNDWIQAIYQDYMLNHYNLSYVAILTSDNKLEILARQNQDSHTLKPQSLVLSSVVEKVMKTVDKKMLITNSSFAADFDGRYYLVSAEPFRDEFTGNIIDNSFLVLVRELSLEYLNKISEKYRLPNLSISKDVKYSHYLSLNGVYPYLDAVNVYWNVSRISKNVFPYTIFFLFSLMAITVSLARLLLSNDHRDREKYHEELFIAATTDPLTSVSNLRHFMQLGKREFQIHVRNKTPLSLLIFDLDYFKSINDTYGHAAGDKALKHFTNLCQDFFRETDIFGRLGGEEFALILPGLGLEKAVSLADNLRVSVCSSPLVLDDILVSLSVSVGAATLVDQNTIDDLLYQADKALYLAKNSGRNIVKSFR